MRLEQVLYDYAMRLVGTPYRWGGDDPMTGFDCSGLCLELLQSAGAFAHGTDASAQQLYNVFKANETPLTSLPVFGSLVFFGKDKKAITHVAFALNALQMLEAGGGGSATVSEDVAAKQNAYVRVRPIAIRKDRVAVVLPSYPQGSV